MEDPTGDMFPEEQNYVRKHGHLRRCGIHMTAAEREKFVQSALRITQELYEKLSQLNSRKPARLKETNI